MTKFSLEAKATFENVKSVTFTAPFVFLVRQTGGTEERDGVEIYPDNEEGVFGSKGTANFKLKWDKKDKFEATLKVLSTKPLTVSRSWKSIAQFETRGLDLIKFYPKTGDVVANSGTLFADSDLENEDGFSEYDEDAKVPVSVTDAEFRIVVG